MSDSEAYSLISKKIEESISVKYLLLNNPTVHEQINRLSKLCATSIKRSGKIIFAGNGGSFADSQHLSAEFTSKFMVDREPFPSIALGTNSSAMSAIANDYGYDHVFSRELSGIASAGDIFIGITTSGNSQNIINAVAEAINLGVHVVVMTGRGAGKISGMCECICVPSDNTARIQESHIMLGHILCELVEVYYENLT
jgi:D-sedoheptulose 7-phosphate isomerase